MMAFERLLITGVIIVGAISVLAQLFTFWHVVEEGYCGFYYQFGRLLDTYTQPGLHVRLPPPITTAISVYVRPQVDSVENVKCGTKDGTLILFPNIEVGNTLPESHAHKVIKEYGAVYDQFLVFKQVQYITNALCSEYTSHEIAIEKFNQFDDLVKDDLETIQKELGTGLLIDFVRIAKPSLPKALDDAYQRQAAERALKKAKEEEFLRIQQENLNEQEKARGAANVKLLESQKQNEILIEKKRAEATQNEIANDMMIKTAKAKADAKKEEAMANKELLTKEYLELKKYEALLHNSKLILTNDLPNNMLFMNAKDLMMNTSLTNG